MRDDFSGHESHDCGIADHCAISLFSVCNLDRC